MTDLTGYTVEQRREAIHQVIYSDRDRRVLELRLIDGWCYKEIGAAVGLEVRQVGRILPAGSAKVGDYLTGKKKKRRLFF